MKILCLIMVLVLVLLPLCLAEQVLWDDDSDIIIYDIWYDIDGRPLTGADCSWQVYNPDGSLNQSGTPSELSVGIINFTVNQLSIGTYPLLINCTKGGYNGTSTKDTIKIIDELPEKYKDRLVQINQTTQEINNTTHDTKELVSEINITTHNIYDFLENNINITLTSILNYTRLTYDNVIDLDINLSSLDSDLSSFRDYVEEKWGTEDAEEIQERLKKIKSDVEYIKSRYYYITEEDKRKLLLSIKEDSREILDLVYSRDKDWEKNLFWIIPIIFAVLLIILIVYLIKRKPEIE